MTVLKENIDYQLVPAPDHDQDWAVRILTGDYVETVLKYGAIGFNEDEEGMMTFNFEVIESPDTDLTAADEDLQEYAGDLLQQIIKQAIEEGTLITKEKE